MELHDSIMFGKMFDYLPENIYVGGCFIYPMASK